MEFLFCSLVYCRFVLILQFLIVPMSVTIRINYCCFSLGAMFAVCLLCRHINTRMIHTNHSLRSVWLTGYLVLFNVGLGIEVPCWQLPVVDCYITPVRCSRYVQAHGCVIV